MKNIVMRKKNWIGHILRGDGLLKDVIEGRMEGKRVPGGRRKSMLYDLLERTYEVLKRLAEDRVSWRNWTPRSDKGRTLMTMMMRCCDRSMCCSSSTQLKIEVLST